MANQVLLVKMAEMAVVADPMLLKTTLGSCVGVVLYDRKHGLCGLAHIVLPTPVRKDLSVGKYAETAIPALFRHMLDRGGSKKNMVAYVAGGANMFRGSADDKIVTVGEKNVAAVKRILANLKLPVVFEETGGGCGRTILFDNGRGRMQVNTLGLVTGLRSRA
jgi:chemotaxis protein CheD